MSEAAALYAQLAVFALVAIAFSSSRSSSLFHPISFYLLFHFLVFVLRPFMVYYLNFQGRWRYMGFKPTPEQFNFTLFVTTVGMLTFVGVCWFIGRAQPSFEKAEIVEYTPAERRALIWTWIVLGPLAFYSAFVASHPVSLGSASGDDIEMVQDMVSGVTIYVNTTGYIVDAQTMLAPLIIMLMWRFRFALWTWAPLIMFILFRAFVGNGRWPMITTTMTLILLQIFRRRKKWFQIRYIALIVPLFVLFQNVGFDRNMLRDAITGTEEPRMFGVPSQDQKSWLQRQDNPDFANFEFLAYVLAVVPAKSRTYTYFTQYLQLFTEPIPRILWHDKPIGAPVKLINLNDYGDFLGLTTSLVGDGWMSGGWLGLTITMIIVAFILGLCHRNFWQKIDKSASVILYCTFLPLTIQWFRDGGISIAKFVLFTFLPILVLRGFTYLFESAAQERRAFENMANRRRSIR